jgi:hypothetical protein
MFQLLRMVCWQSTSEPSLTNLQWDRDTVCDIQGKVGLVRMHSILDSINHAKELQENEG